MTQGFDPVPTVFWTVAKVVVLKDIPKLELNSEDFCVFLRYVLIL